MAPDPRPTFRAQAESAAAGFAGIATYLLQQVASRTEVRTEGDRALVGACTVGAIVTGAVLLLLVVGAWLRRRRERAALAADAGREGGGQGIASGPSDPDGSAGG